MAISVQEARHIGLPISSRPLGASPRAQQVISELSPRTRRLGGQKRTSSWGTYELWNCRLAV